MEMGLRKTNAGWVGGQKGGESPLSIASIRSVDRKIVAKNEDGMRISERSLSRLKRNWDWNVKHSFPNFNRIITYSSVTVHQILRNQQAVKCIRIYSFEKDAMDKWRSQRCKQRLRWLLRSLLRSLSGVTLIAHRCGTNQMTTWD